MVRAEVAVGVGVVLVEVPKKLLWCRSSRCLRRWFSYNLRYRPQPILIAMEEEGVCSLPPANKGVFQ
jgi:hypothetical protein